MADSTSSLLEDALVAWKMLSRRNLPAAVPRASREELMLRNAACFCWSWRMRRWASCLGRASIWRSCWMSAPESMPLIRPTDDVMLPMTRSFRGSPRFARSCAARSFDGRRGCADRNSTVCSARGVPASGRSDQAARRRGAAQGRSGSASRAGRDRSGRVGRSSPAAFSLSTSMAHGARTRWNMSRASSAACSGASYAPGWPPQALSQSRTGRAGRRGAQESLEPLLVSTVWAGSLEPLAGWRGVIPGASVRL